jgi:DNA-binding NarL/FixJ family response regulator
MSVSRAPLFPRDESQSPRRGALLQGAAALAALDTALNALDPPAFIVDLAGQVLSANANGRTLLDRDRRGVSRSMAQAIAGASTALVWDLIPLQSAREPRGFLAILRTRRQPAIVADSVGAASERWQLTVRQAQVLRLVARGLTNVIIADTLGISVGTVEFHLSAIFDKAGVDSRARLIVSILEP